MAFLTIANDPLTAQDLGSFEGGSEVEFQIKIDCEDGKRLKSQNIADMTVKGKHSGAAEFVNLETAGIDLSDWSESREIFDIKLELTNPAANRIKNFDLYLENV